MSGAESLKFKIKAFRYVEDDNQDESPIATTLAERRHTPRVSKPSAPKRVNTAENHLLDLAPSLADNLCVVFVGYNPGIQSLVQQHHYAHFSNHFWKLFNDSRLLLRALQIQLAADLNLYDKYLCTITNGVESFATPACDYNLVKYGIGFTDLVLRCTRTAQELTLEEKLQNVPRLITEFQSSNVENVVFIGKGIWEVVVSAMAKELGIKVKLSKSNFIWGQQQERHGPLDRTYNMVLTHFRCKLPPKCRVYVFPNTSGLVSNPTNATKQALWAELSEDIKHNASSKSRALR